MRKIRKINLNKTFAAAMAAVLSAVVFTACGNSDNSSSSKSDGSSSHVTEKAEMRDITSMDLVKK